MASPTDQETDSHAVHRRSIVDHDHAGIDKTSIPETTPPRSVEETFDGIRGNRVWDSTEWADAARLNALSEADASRHLELRADKAGSRVRTVQPSTRTTEQSQQPTPSVQARKQLSRRTPAERQARASQALRELKSGQAVAVVGWPFPDLSGPRIAYAAPPMAAMLQSLADANVDVRQAVVDPEHPRAFIHAVQDMDVPMTVTGRPTPGPLRPLESVRDRVKAFFVLYDPAKNADANRLAIQQMIEARDEYAPDAAVIVAAPTLLLNQQSGMRIDTDILKMGDAVAVWGRGSGSRVASMLGSDIQVVSVDSSSLNHIRDHAGVSQRERNIGKRSAVELLYGLDPIDAAQVANDVGISVDPQLVRQSQRDQYGLEPTSGETLPTSGVPSVEGRKRTEFSLGA